MGLDHVGYKKLCLEFWETSAWCVRLIRLDTPTPTPPQLSMNRDSISLFYSRKVSEVSPSCSQTDMCYKNVLDYSVQISTIKCFLIQEFHPIIRLPMQSKWSRIWPHSLLPLPRFRSCQKHSNLLPVFYTSRRAHSFCISFAFFSLTAQIFLLPFRRLKGTLCTAMLMMLIMKES